MTNALSIAASHEPDEFDELEVDDLSHFVNVGFRNLMRAMFKQSLNDIVTDRKDAHASAEIGVSARWLKSPVGRDCISFLMPGISADKFIAKVYEDPERILAAMKGTEGDQVPVATAVSTFTLDAVNQVETAEEQARAAQDDELASWVEMERPQWG